MAPRSSFPVDEDRCPRVISVAPRKMRVEAAMVAGKCHFVRNRSAIAAASVCLLFFCIDLATKDEMWMRASAASFDWQ